MRVGAGRWGWGGGEGGTSALPPRAYVVLGSRQSSSTPERLLFGSCRSLSLTFGSCRSLSLSLSLSLSETDTDRQCGFQMVATAVTGHLRPTLCTHRTPPSPSDFPLFSILMFH